MASVGRDLEAYLVPSPLLWTRTPVTRVQSPIHPGLEDFQGWVIQKCQVPQLCDCRKSALLPSSCHSYCTESKATKTQEERMNIRDSKGSGGLQTITVV